MEGGENLLDDFVLGDDARKTEVTLRVVGDPALAPLRPNGSNPGEQPVTAIMGHISPDSEPESTTAVSNGLSLCKIQRGRLRVVPRV